jgi:integrase
MPFSLASAPKATRFSNRAMPPALAAEVLSKLDLSLDTDRAILCALTLGLRSGDLTRKLSWENVDFEKGEVTLTTGKTGEVICNPLPPAVLERLRPHAKPSGLVCPLKNPSTAVPRRTQSLVGQRYGLHSMRKAYATGLANSGVNLKLVAQLLAHRSVLTSAGYVIPDDQAKREAVNRIGYLQPPEGE